MFDLVSKMVVVNENFDRLVCELSDMLKFVIADNDDTKIFCGFSSNFEPFIYKVDFSAITDFYDDCIYTSYEDERFDIFDYFDGDLDRISVITGISIEKMREHAARLLDCDENEIDGFDILRTLGASDKVVRRLEESRRTEIFADRTGNIKKMAKNILQNYLYTLEVKNIDPCVCEYRYDRTHWDTTKGEINAIFGKNITCSFCRGGDRNA